MRAVFIDWTAPIHGPYSLVLFLSVVFAPFFLFLLLFLFYFFLLFLFARDGFGTKPKHSGAERTAQTGAICTQKGLMSYVL